MITYDAFFKTIHERGIAQYELIKNKVITPPILQRMRDNGNIRTDTLDKICTYLQCDISDVISYVSPEEYRKRQTENQRKKIAELEQKLAELKESEKQDEKN